jgi:hypothetical protein
MLFQSYHVAIETTHSLAEICKVLHVNGSSVPSGSLQSLRDTALHDSRGRV